MGALQLGVMFLSVVGPFAGLIGAIVMLWHRTSGYGVGGAEVLVMLCM
jgi:hypothetical protein